MCASCRPNSVAAGSAPTSVPVASPSPLASKTVEVTSTSGDEAPVISQNTNHLFSSIPTAGSDSTLRKHARACFAAVGLKESQSGSSDIFMSRNDSEEKFGDGKKRHRFDVVAGRDDGPGPKGLFIESSSSDTYEIGKAGRQEWTDWEPVAPSRDENKLFEQLIIACDKELPPAPEPTPPP